MTVTRHIVTTIFALTIAALAVSTDAIGQSSADAPSSPHEVRTAKFTVDDVDKARAFYEEMFDLTEINRFVVEGRLVEPLLGYEGKETSRIGLLGFTEHENLEKSPIPVVALYSGNFDEVIKRLEDAKHPVTLLPGAETPVGFGSRSPATRPATASKSSTARDHPRTAARGSSSRT